MNISPEHFRYLVIQRGEVSDQRHDFTVWKAAYEKSLLDIYSTIHPILPEHCKNVLDIGSGLGGIDLLLARRYRGLEITLLDGLDCPADVHSHHEPFSNARVAQDFHRKNGSDAVTCCFPAPDPTQKFDLIISFAAYCFHILPCDYMDVMKRAMHEDTVVVLDVRRTRPDWLEQVVSAFGKPIVLKQEKKYVRLAFGCRQSSSFAAVSQ